MKSLMVLVLGAAAGVFAAASAQLSSVHKVYLMPMSSGLDQYLAERLTREGVFTVVVDPQQADAVLSERVDPAFGETLQGMYPGHEAKKKEEKKDPDAGSSRQLPRRTMGRGRGNVFLVAVHSRQVLWSTYLKLEDRSSSGLHRAARDIVKQMKKDLEEK